MKDGKNEILENCQKIQKHIVELNEIIKEYANTCAILLTEVERLEKENEVLKLNACKCGTKGK